MNEKIRKTHVRNTHQKKRSGTKCSQHFVKQTFTVFNEMFFLMKNRDRYNQLRENIVGIMKSVSAIRDSFPHN